MIPLNEIVGLPPSTPPAELDHASEQYCQAVRDRASQGDAAAQRQLVELRIAYLNWAYASPRSESMIGNSPPLSAVVGVPKGSLAPVAPLQWN